MKRREFLHGLAAIGATSGGLIPVTASSAGAPALSESLRREIEMLSAIENLPVLRPGELKDRPVLVNFFASWCPPCRIEFSHLNKVNRKLRSDRLRIVALNVFEQWDDNDAVRMQRFISDTRPEFTVLRGNESIRNGFGGINRIPTVYGFDRSGKLLYTFIHHRGATKTNASYEELSAASALLLESDQ